MSDKILLSFRVSSDTRDSFKIECIKNGWSMTQVLEFFMENYVAVSSGYKQLDEFKKVFRIGEDIDGN